MEQHDETANELEEQAERMDQETDELEEKIDSLREDWDQKAQSERVPGAQPVPEQGPEPPPEGDDS